MSYEIIGVEIGVLLSPNHEEFKDYSCVNKNYLLVFLMKTSFLLVMINSMISKNML